MKTTKVVYNGCYGGFGLSSEGIELLAKLEGVTLYKAETESHIMPFKYFTKPLIEGKGDYKFVFDHRSFERHHPSLVQVVETLGELAGDRFSHLMIEEITKDYYYIDEYDGSESVITESDINWISVK